MSNRLTPPRETVAARLATTISSQDWRAELTALAASTEFAKAPRMVRLLRYLVEKAIEGDAASCSEEAIGLAVFERDARNYYPSEDPIVRVQTGRLRARLTAHYDKAGNRRAFQIVLSSGSYLPVVQRQLAQEFDFAKSYLLAVHPVRCISGVPAARHFADGLSEELADELFRFFGNQVVSPHFVADSRSIGAASHFLEGSLRVCGEHLRASFRLVDAAVGSIAWSAQFERPVALTLEAEQHLAKEVCDALRKYYCQAW